MPAGEDKEGWGKRIKRKAKVAEHLPMKKTKNNRHENRLLPCESEKVSLGVKSEKHTWEAKT